MFNTNTRTASQLAYDNNIYMLVRGIFIILNDSHIFQIANTATEIRGDMKTHSKKIVSMGHVIKAPPGLRTADEKKAFIVSHVAKLLAKGLFLKGTWKGV
jgi:hypothetical protein